MIYIIFLFASLFLNIGVVWLSFLGWYERELRYQRIFSISLIISLLISLGIYFLSNNIPSDLLYIYYVISTTLLFLMFPEIYLLVVWLRKGSHKSFLILSVASFIAILWVILPIIFYVLPTFTAFTILISVYVAGVILGTLFSVAIIEEVRPRDGYITASAATAALSISDAVSKRIHNFAIFVDIKIQLAILIASTLISWFLYKRATD